MTQERAVQIDSDQKDDLYLYERKGELQSEVAIARLNLVKARVADCQGVGSMNNACQSLELRLDTKALNLGC